MLRYRRGCIVHGVPEALQDAFDSQSHVVLSQLKSSDDRYNEIPPEYGAALPLDTVGQHMRDITGSFGYPSVLYKVIDRRSGVPYALRRVDGARISYKVRATLSNLSIYTCTYKLKVVSSVRCRWRGIQHPNLATLHRIFMHSGALYFVHEYIPLAQSMLDYYFGSYVPAHGNIHPCMF